jgi:hypothetical protein
MILPLFFTFTCFSSRSAVSSIFAFCWYFNWFLRVQCFDEFLKTLVVVLSFLLASCPHHLVKESHGINRLLVRPPG